MSTKSREVIWGGQIMSAKTRAESARREARKAAREADHAEAEAWSVRMEGYGGPAQPSPTIGQCLNGGYGWLEIECCRCKTRASMPLDAIRRARDTPIWTLEPSFRCRSCGTRRYKPPVRMIKLTEQREIMPYKWVHPDEERWKYSVRQHSDPRHSLRRGCRRLRLRGLTQRLKLFRIDENEILEASCRSTF